MIGDLLKSKEVLLKKTARQTSLSQIQDDDVIMYKMDWNALGSYMANKIKDELLAMISIGTIITYAKRKAWKELATIVIKYVAKAWVRTNVAFIAGQLAIWGYNAA